MTNTRPTRKRKQPPQRSPRKASKPSKNKITLPASDLTTLLCNGVNRALKEEPIRYAIAPAIMPTYKAAYINEKLYIEVDEDDSTTMSAQTLESVVNISLFRPEPMEEESVESTAFYDNDEETHDSSQTDIGEALRLAASSLQDDMEKLVRMVGSNPQLLLQKGNVITRGGLQITNTTLYEFFIGAGAPVDAQRIEFGFEAIPDGENERLKQVERYRPYIENLAKQIEADQSDYDLCPLFKILMSSSPQDIQEALDVNDPDRLATRNTPLRAELAKIRRAINANKNIAGMHYQHYTTLIQAFKLLIMLFQFSGCNTVIYDIKKASILRQVIDYYLQHHLPAVDLFEFSYAFRHERWKRHDPSFFSPDPRIRRMQEYISLDLTGFYVIKRYYENKFKALQELCHARPRRNIACTL